MTKIQSFMFMSLTLLTSCSTILSGTRQSIGIASNPTNASVSVDRAFVGNTPIIVDMTRKNDHLITIELEGYQPYEITCSRKLNGWVFGNIIFGGFIGLAVDAVSGAIYSLTPDQIHAELRSHQVIHSNKSEDSFIVVVLQPDPSWKKVGNLVAAK